MVVNKKTIIKQLKITKSNCCSKLILAVSQRLFKMLLKKLFIDIY